MAEENDTFFGSMYHHVSVKTGWGRLWPKGWVDREPEIVTAFEIEFGEHNPTMMVISVETAMKLMDQLRKGLQDVGYIRKPK